MNRYRFIAPLGTLALLSVALFACSGGHQGPPPVFIEATTVQSKDWQPSLHTTGTVSAIQGATLQAEAAGRITQIAFTPGTDVAADSLLLEINPAVSRANLQQFESKATLNKVNYTRSQELYKKKVIAKADLDQALSNWQSAEADLNKAKAELAQLVVHAPFAGRVGLNLVNVGDYVNVGDSLVSLQKIDPLRVDFRVPERDAAQIAPGQSIELTAAAYPDEKFAGKVEAIDASIDRNTRTLGVRAYVQNPAHHLLPGGFASVTIYVGKSNQTLFLPQEAIVSETTGNFVYRIEEGKAHKVPVEIGKRIEDNIVVLSGLKAGDSVVNGGQLKLHDGDTVMVPPPADKKPEAAAK